MGGKIKTNILTIPVDDLLKIICRSGMLRDTRATGSSVCDVWYSPGRKVLNIRIQGPNCNMVDSLEEAPEIQVKFHTR